ncbi:MAG: hypothetical protein BWY74_04396 [Firmicutes bacterium ADurb.Bin419]|nr:MAG: hypothetical protein BWY74_04396 [Firmicutes bacterium ADurb.Bin419]
MFMLTAYEKEKVIQNIDHFTDAFYNDADGKLFIKLLSNYIKITFPDIRLTFDDVVFLDKLEFRHNIEKILRTMLEVQNESIKTYTTGQLAKFFGVSITAINNWIDQGRFIGIKRDSRHKQVRIPENTLWESNTNGRILVRSVVEMWQKEQEKYIPLDKESEQIALEEEINFFVKKYNGKYEDTLMHYENKTSEQLQDEAEWKYLLRRKAHDESFSL